MMESNWCPQQCSIEDYVAPEFARHLKNVPQKRVKLAQLPTPVHKWELPGVPDDFEIFIKRDDLSGSMLSGNKIRKLEFILAEAKRQGCSHVITVGGATSNHCRATALSCAQLGFKAHLILASKNTNPDELPSTGNMLLNKLSGANVYLIDAQYEDQVTWPPQAKLAQKISETTGGETSYLIPLGGTDKMGVFGYIEEYNELLSGGVIDHVTDIVVACGSGGTIAGLAIANYLSGNSDKVRLHAVLASDCYSTQYTHDIVNDMLKLFEIDAKSEDLINVVEGFIGPGYGLTNEADLALIKETAMKTGIILDPVYTAKATQALVTQTQNKPEMFKGKRILFIYTGGIFGAMNQSQLIESVTEKPTGVISTLDESMK